MWRNLIICDEWCSGQLLLPETASCRRLLAAVIAHIGDGWLWILFGVLAYLLGDALLRDRVVRWGAAALLAGGMVGLLKKLLRRQRPTEAPGFYSLRYDAHSFPSGHAARMGVAACMGPLVCPAWGWLAVPCALLVAWARVALGVHYLLDVVVGLGLGVAAAFVASAL
jgi:undecaprenyl-diphosphatase